MHRTRMTIAGFTVCVAILGTTQPGAAQAADELRSCRGHAETATASIEADLSTWTEAELVEWFGAIPPGEFGVWIEDSPGDDVIVGTNGNDIIVLREGNNVVCAGDGHDVLIGVAEEPTSVVFMGPGDDIVASSDGTRRIHGGPGRDLLVTSTGVEVVRGGRGSDEIIFTGDNRVVLRGGPGSDRIGADGPNIRAYGGPGADALQSSWGSVVFRGGPGSDQLFAPEPEEIFAKSQLRGGGGNDYLVGHEQHVFRGGPGTDTCAFRFSNEADPDVQRNAICDQESFVFGGDAPVFDPPASWWTRD